MSSLKTLHLLSGGAAQGFTDAATDGLAVLGIRLQGTFGAVGAMQEKLLAGAPCDVFISTAAMLQDLAQQGRIDGASIRALGRVATGIAVKAGRMAPTVTDAGSLRAALLAATEIHCPDTLRSTAGIHFAKVLQSLGVADALASRLQMHPNGMTAMRAVAASQEPLALGCTQITEILYTPGVQYVGDLPAGFALSTVYSAGVVAASAAGTAAGQCVQWLAGADAAELRRQSGFALQA